MANSLPRDSQISLILLEESRPNSQQNEATKESSIQSQNSNHMKRKSYFSGFFNRRKRRKIADCENNQNGHIVSNSWTKNKGQNKPKKMKSEQTNIHSNGIHNLGTDKNVPTAEKTEETEKKQSFLSWLKSLFGKNESQVNINESNKKKLMYIGLVLPAFAAHPESLEQCKAAKDLEDFQFHLAAAHVEDALHGRGKFGKARALLNSKTVQKCFHIITSKYWEYFLYLFIVLHCFMPFWEQSPIPTPIGQTWSDNWELPTFVLVIDALCMVVYTIDITLWIIFLSWEHFLKAKENYWIRVECVFTMMFIIDYVILVLEKTLNLRLIPPFRCLRAAMLLCKSKNVAHIFNVLVSITSRLGKVFAIIFIFIFTFASIGLHLYMYDYHEIPEICTNATATWNCTDVYSGAFDQIAIASLHMFVLMSTENYPDVMIPAYNASVANFFYFMFYLYAGVFFLTAILLAIIVESYWEYSKKHVKMERLRQRQELIKAWNLLDQKGDGYLSVDDPKLLKIFKILRPKNSDEENQDLLSYMSEMNEDHIIEPYDWTTRLVETLSFEFEREEEDDNSSDSVSGENPSCWKKFRRLASTVIHARGIGVAILVLILLHSVVFCLMWASITDETQLGLQIFRSTILFVFFVEVTLRILSDGSKLLNILDILDILMVIVAIAGNFTWYILWYSYTHSEILIYLGACVVASSLAVLARLLLNSEQARSAIYILRSIYPVMFDLILLVITIIYFYAILGLEIFQDQTLEKSRQSGFDGSYVQYDCGVGFETFGCAMMIVFQIVTTNDWHQIMLGAMIDAGWASAFYFVTCYLFINMIVMNLFVAISIEAYKKLARDSRDTAQPIVSESDAQDADENLTENKGDNNNSSYFKNKNERSLAAAAKNAITDLFEPARVPRKTSSNVPYGGSLPGTQQIGRRGPRGSIAATSIQTVSSDDNSDDDTVIGRRSLPGTPRKTLRSSSSPEGGSTRKRLTSVGTPGLRKTSSIKSPNGDRRQGRMKARSDKIRRERREAKQLQQTPPAQRRDKDNQLHVPSPKLSISDIVKLKKMVKVLVPYKARTSKEMSLEEGSMLVVTGEKDAMYKGPAGWFPKTHTLDMDIKVEDGGPFSGNEKVDSPSLQRKRRTGKVVNFQVEVETAEKFNNSPSSSPRYISPHPIQPRLSQANLRMRKKIGGEDWRRNILGDMTVMNKDEMQLLTEQLKGGNLNSHRRQGRATVSGSYRPPKRLEEETIQEAIEEKEEEALEVPEVTVSAAPVPSPNNSSESEDSITKTSNTLTLTVPGAVTKKMRKPKQTSGEMPGWAKDFASKKGIRVQENVNFDETDLPSAGSSDDEDRLSKLAGVLVHRSDTSTGSSMENLTETPESTTTSNPAKIESEPKNSSMSLKTSGAQPTLKTDKPENEKKTINNNKALNKNKVAGSVT